MTPKYFVTEQERRGTIYHEFFKGKWDEKTFGKEDSLFLHDDILYKMDLERIFRKVALGYRSYNETEINREQWKQIREIASGVSGEVENLILEIEPWVEDNFKEHAVFTILGI